MSVHDRDRGHDSLCRRSAARTQAGVLERTLMCAMIVFALSAVTLLFMKWALGPALDVLKTLEDALGGLAAAVPETPDTAGVTGR